MQRLLSGQTCGEQGTVENERELCISPLLQGSADSVEAGRERAEGWEGLRNAIFWTQRGSQ